MKTTGLNTTVEDDESVSPFESDSDEDIATDLEVSKYSFHTILWVVRQQGALPQKPLLVTNVGIQYEICTRTVLVKW